MVETQQDGTSANVYIGFCMRHRMYRVDEVENVTLLTLALAQRVLEWKINYYSSSLSEVRKKFQCENVVLSLFSQLEGYQIGNGIGVVECTYIVSRVYNVTYTFFSIPNRKLFFFSFVYSFGLCQFIQEFINIFLIKCRFNFFFLVVTAEFLQAI